MAFCITIDKSIRSPTFSLIPLKRWTLKNRSRMIYGHVDDFKGDFTIFARFNATTYIGNWLKWSMPFLPRWCNFNKWLQINRYFFVDPSIILSRFFFSHYLPLKWFSICRKITWLFRHFDSNRKLPEATNEQLNW